jgi:DNA repair protein RadD
MLRRYQQDSVDALFQFNLDKPNKSTIIVIPTGGGKTRVMAEIIRKSFEANPNCKGMILSHVKELLEQSENTCKGYATATGLPVESIGIFSASMKRKEVKPLTIAGIQSVYRKADSFGVLDFVMIDECHLISQNKETMYRKFLSCLKIRNPNLKVIGLTATPFRLQSGIIFGEGKTFDDCCYAIGVKDLIMDGYLSPLITMGADSPDLKKVRIRGGEFLDSDLNKILETEELVYTGVNDAIKKAKDRNSVLVFGTSVRHAEMILEELKKQNQSCSLITGETPLEIREFTINSFRENKIKWLVNVAVLTTGFDAPNIDCVVVMKPTMSKGLWYQMVGRGFRLNQGKLNCLVLDYGDNALRHGCIDQIEVDAKGMEIPAAKVKKCPACKLVYKVHIPVCPSCGYIKPKHEIPEISSKLSGTQSQGDIMNGRKPREFEIVATAYSIYRKHPQAEPCIMETHETFSGDLIRSYHSLKPGLEFSLWKWLKGLTLNLPRHHWHLDKIKIQSMDFLNTLPRPISIIAHKNEKGYYQIDSYQFEKVSV